MVWKKKKGEEMLHSETMEPYGDLLVTVVVCMRVIFWVGLDWFAASFCQESTVII